MAKTDLQKALEEAVEKSLPKVAGEMLQKRLQEADEMEERIKGLELLLETANNETKSWISTHDKLKKTYSDLLESTKSLKEDQEKLAVDIANLNQARQMLEVTLLKKELELIKESRAEIKELTATIFKNTTLRENIMRNVYQPGSTNYDNHTNQSVWQPTGPLQDNGEIRETTKE